MKIPFDKVIVSSDDNPKFINFWPIVKKAWTKFFPEVQVDLCFVTDKKSEYKWLEEIGTVHYYDIIPNVPRGNLGKVCRLYHASLQENLVCSIHDIDSIPLQRNYLFDLLSLRKPEHYCMVGAECYSGRETGKAPMVPTTSEGYVFQQLLNTQNKNWNQFIESIKNIKVFDDKENILNSDNPILYPDNHFSDESLVRYFIKSFSGKIQHLRRDEIRKLNPQQDWIDRTYRNFTFDKVKLQNGFYTECNMLRPFNHERMKDIIEYLQ